MATKPKPSRAKAPPRQPADPSLPSLYGRPIKFTSQRRELLLNALRGGSTLTAACALADIHLETLRVHREADLEFSGQVERAQEEAVTRMASRVQKAAYEAEVIETINPATGLVTSRRTKYDWKAAAWWLERRGGPEWRKEDGPGGPTVNVNVGVAIGQPVEFEPDRRFAQQVVSILQIAGELPEEADPNVIGPLLLAPAEPVPPARPERP